MLQFEKKRASSPKNYNLVTEALAIALIAISVNTSHDWRWKEINARAELLRFDKISLFGEVNFYHIFAFAFLIVILYRWLVHRGDNVPPESSYMKRIFWGYFVGVSLLVYFAVWIDGIKLIGLGVAPLVLFFTYLVIACYAEDVFWGDKDRSQVYRSLRLFQYLILIRCGFSLGKFILGIGEANPFFFGVRIGSEPDFADFYVLVFTLSYAGLLFERQRLGGIVSVAGVAAPLFITILSFRRFAWIELLVSATIVTLAWYRKTSDKLVRLVVAMALVTITGGLFLLFSNVVSLRENYFVGRLFTVFSLLDPSMSSAYGSESGHIEEIRDGLANASRHWLLGVTPFGSGLISRQYAVWQPGMYIHNEFLFVWVTYGLLGLLLLCYLYYCSMRTGLSLMRGEGETLGLVLVAFTVAQLAKDVVWPTVIIFENLTVMYIFLVTAAVRLQRIAKKDGRKVDRLSKFSTVR